MYVDYELEGLRYRAGRRVAALVPVAVHVVEMSAGRQRQPGSRNTTRSPDCLPPTVSLN